MIEEARKDLIPTFILVAIAFILDANILIKLVTLAPLVYFVLYLFKSVKPRGVFVPKRPPRDTSFAEAMLGYAHPALMPGFLYWLIGMMYFVLGIFTCLFGPVSKYFMNWSQVMFGMSSNNLKPVPGEENRQAPNIPRPPRHSTVYKSEKTVPPKPSHRGSTIVPPTPRQAKVNSKAAAEKAIERDLLAQIENNYYELKNIRENSEKVLDSIFGNSRITRDRYLSGLDEALEVSRANCKAAQEYVKVGHNLDILRKYYERSVQTNKGAADLLDSLVTHQQDELDDDFDDMSERLNELQSTIKYYQTH